MLVQTQAVQSGLDTSELDQFCKEFSHFITSTDASQALEAATIGVFKSLIKVYPSTYQTVSSVVVPEACAVMGNEMFAGVGMVMLEVELEAYW